MKKITLVAIDGLGTETDDYEKLCILIHKNFKCLNIDEILFFTSNINYKNNNFNVKYLEKPLNYLDLNVLMLQNIADYSDAEKFIFVQLDGYPLNEDLWDERFLDYDYIGAPWPAGKPWTGNNSVVGNGGFCIRSRKLYNITKNISNYPNYFINGRINEDVFISVLLRPYLENHGIKFAPVELAKKFSIEIPISADHKIENCFGFHGKSHLQKLKN
jgi:hypothetical protein